VDESVRRWGNSATFLKEFDKIKETFSYRRYEFFSAEMLVAGDAVQSVTGKSFLADKGLKSCVAFNSYAQVG
jgi:hypothetical protein